MGGSGINNSEAFTVPADGGHGNLLLGINNGGCGRASSLLNGHHDGKPHGLGHGNRLLHQGVSGAGGGSKGFSSGQNSSHRGKPGGQLVLGLEKLLSVFGSHPGPIMHNLVLGSNGIAVHNVGVGHDSGISNNFIAGHKIPFVPLNRFFWH